MGDRFTEGYRAARRHYGTGASAALADVRAAVLEVRSEHPSGPAFYTELLDQVEQRTRDWAHHDGCSREEERPR